MEEKTFKSIYIPNPCHENWATMTPMEKGRFCQSCQKKVFDFRSAKPEEIEIVFIKSKGEACGTFYDDQLNQNRKYLHIEKGIFQRLKFRTAAIFAALWFKLFFTSQAFGQKAAEAHIQKDTIELSSSEAAFKEQGKIIKGKLINTKSCNGIGFAQVDLKDKRGTRLVTATTDAEGNFKIAVKESDQRKELYLISPKETRKTHFGRIIRQSTSRKVEVICYTEMITLEAEVLVKKKLFRKKRMIRTGRFRME